jgi:hypothetical protein
VIHVTLPYSSRHLGVALSSRLRDVHCCSALLDAPNQARFHGDPECQLVLELTAGGWLTDHHTATLCGSERNHGKVLRCRELRTALRFVHTYLLLARRLPIFRLASLCCVRILSSWLFGCNEDGPGKPLACMLVRT